MSNARDLSKVVNEDGASLVGYLPSGTGAVATDLQSKLREIVSVKDFGATGGGIVDDGPAIQAALNYINSIGGGEVYLPPGTYRRAKGTPSLTTITVYSNTTLRGSGAASIIKFEDSSAIPRQDLFKLSNTSNVTLRDFRITGDWDAYPNQTNQSQCITGSFIENLRLESVTVEKVRFMATAFDHVDGASVSNCTFDTVARDGVRFTDSSQIRVCDNTFRFIGDNATAFHTTDNTENPLTFGEWVVSGNTFEKCVFSASFGAKSLTYTNNVHKYCTGGILVSSGGGEGATTQYAVNISDNMFIDTLRNYNGQFVNVITINGPVRSAGTLPAVPGFPNTATGLIDQPYGYFEGNNTIVNNLPNLGLYWLKIDGNTITRTQPIGAQFTAAGLGQLFSNSSGFYDLTLADADIPEMLLDLRGYITNTTISGNTLQGTQVTSTNAQAIHFFQPTDNLLSITKCLISKNVISDCPRGALYHNVSPATTLDIVIDGNHIDCDPYFRNPFRVAGNKWTAAGNCTAITTAGISGTTVSNNHFRNCSQTGTNPATSNIRGNFVYMGIVAAGFSANNLGVGVCPYGDGRQETVVHIQGNPSLANYGGILTIPAIQSAAMPTTGTYARGHYVSLDSAVEAGTSPNKYSILGYSRITTNSNHVLNVDWRELRCLTGN